MNIFEKHDTYLFTKVRAESADRQVSELSWAQQGMLKFSTGMEEKYIRNILDIPISSSF